jgi:predicted outer membrane repeat protein
MHAMGGGVYTPGYLTIAYSQVVDNAVIASGRATGGGAQVGNFYGVPGDDTFVKYSTFSGNSAGAGGGLYATGDIFITNSTISHNAGGNTGGILMFNLGGATGEWRLLNSTVSGNDSNVLTGGVYIRGNDARIENSTIAFNDSVGSNKYGAGVTVRSIHNLHLNSTLISNNYTDLLGDELGPQVDDIGGVDGATLTGTDNLIYFPSSLVTPPGTILLTDPALAPLAANGGPTATHGLYPGSPALDAGNNTQGTLTDQRGTGYPRNIGPSPDIGAFEGTVSDTIFTDGFD